MDRLHKHMQCYMSAALQKHHHTQSLWLAALHWPLHASLSPAT